MFARIAFLSMALMASTGGFTQHKLSLEDSLKSAGNLTEAIRILSVKYRANPSDKASCYQLAANYSLKGYLDSAVFFVKQFLLLDTTERIVTDPDFLNLYKYKTGFWKDVESSALRKLQEKQPAAFKNAEVIKKLWHLFALDQAYYYEIQVSNKLLGSLNSLKTALWELKSIINRQNVDSLYKMINRYGWPKSSQVGAAASEAAFMIIQHNADTTLLKKCLPLVKKLCEQKEYPWQLYALMSDKLAVRQGKKQQFGSQAVYNDQTGLLQPFPIEDEKNVDLRRKKMGMEPIADYYSNIGGKYIPPVH